MLGSMSRRLSTTKTTRTSASTNQVAVHCQCGSTGLSMGGLPVLNIKKRKDSQNISAIPSDPLHPATSFANPLA